MRTKLWIPAAAGSAALALVATTGIVTALHKNDVELVVDGAASTIAVREDTVGEVLALEGITVGEHDIVLPAADTRITDDMEITVAYGRPLTVTVDGKQREVWTTAKSVGEALSYLNLDEADSKLSTSRSTAIGRTGLAVEVATAKDVTLTVGGTPSAVTAAGTVGDVLQDAGIVPDADDIVTPSPETVLTDGLAVAFVDVETKQVEKGVAVPFTSKRTTSSELLKGTKKVTTKGVEGLRRETWTEVYHDGVLASSTLAGSVMSRQPVHQVTTVGTKAPPRKAVAPKAAAKDTESKAATPSSGGSSSGGAINLARAGMWDRIARCESGNNWSINTGNGYYGGLQFNLQTWRSVNGQDFASYPHQASRAEQITVANRLYARRGTQPWSCA